MNWRLLVVLVAGGVAAYVASGLTVAWLLAVVSADDARVGEEL